MIRGRGDVVARFILLLSADAYARHKQGLVRADGRTPEASACISTQHPPFDPQEFWYAWARGERMKIDLFGPQWDYWAATSEPIDALRTRIGVTA
jgi:hypothetical protein